MGYTGWIEKCFCSVSRHGLAFAYRHGIGRVFNCMYICFYKLLEEIHDTYLFFSFKIMASGKPWKCGLLSLFRFPFCWHYHTPKLTRCPVKICINHIKIGINIYAYCRRMRWYQTRITGNRRVLLCNISLHHAMIFCTFWYTFCHKKGSWSDIPLPDQLQWIKLLCFYLSALRLRKSFSIRDFQLAFSGAAQVRTCVIASLSTS